MANVQVPLGPKDLDCPLWKKAMVKVCHKCPWWGKVTLEVAPQSKAGIDEWGCAMSFMPQLLLENSKQQRGTGKAIESFRNETVKHTHETQKVTAMLGNAVFRQQPPEAVPQISGGRLAELEHDEGAN